MVWLGRGGQPGDSFALTISAAIRLCDLVASVCEGGSDGALKIAGLRTAGNGTVRCCHIYLTTSHRYKQADKGELA